MKKALKDSWKTLPMPEQTVEIKLRREFSKEEFEKMSMGHIPREMEDKWFIYFENYYAYFHRSWTGYCIFKVDFEKQNASFLITQVTANRDDNQYRNKDKAEDIRMLISLIERKLLNYEAPFTLSDEIPEEFRKKYVFTIE